MYVLVCVREYVCANVSIDSFVEVNEDGKNTHHIFLRKRLGNISNVMYIKYNALYI